jgi:hypothetical protein
VTLWHCGSADLVGRMLVKCEEDWVDRAMTVVFCKLPVCVVSLFGTQQFSQCSRVLKLSAPAFARE